jgi:hypothetical protein
METLIIFFVKNSFIKLHEKLTLNDGWMDGRTWSQQHIMMMMMIIIIISFKSAAAILLYASHILFHISMHIIFRHYNDAISLS